MHIHVHVQYYKSDGPSTQNSLSLSWFHGGKLDGILDENCEIVRINHRFPHPTNKNRRVM